MASHSRRKASCELDQYAPSMAEELLAGLNEWKHVPDIVRLTLKALSDIIQTQGAAIHELERQMPGKASKSELTAGLSSKANISDVTQAVLDASVSQKDQISPHKLEALLTEKVSKAELSSILRSAVTEKDVRALIEQKVSTRVFEAEVKALQEVFEEMQRNHLSQVQRLETEIQELCHLLDQKADSSEVDKVAQGKANRQSVINALYTKVSKEELEAVFGDLKTLQQTIDSMVDHNAEVVAELRAEMTAQGQTCERHISAMRGDLASVSKAAEMDGKRLSLIAGQMDQKADTEKVTSVFTAFKVDIGDIAGVLKKEQTTIEEKCAVQIRDTLKICEKNTLSLEGRLQQLQDSLFAISGELAGKCDELDHRVATVHATSVDAKSLHSDVLVLIEDLNKRKAETKDVSEVKRMLSDSLAKQADYGSVQKREFERYKEALLEHVKHTQADFTRYVETVAVKQSHQDMAVLQKEVAACARSKDIQPLIDAKANVDDLTRGLLDLHKDLEARVSLPEFHSLFTELKSVTESLLLENCTARWLWTSGSIKPDRRIPWEVQTINTRSDNFIWEEGQVTVYTVAPGLYEVSLGVFTRVRPKVQLFINDQAVFRLGFSDGDAGKQWAPHIDGNLIGQTMEDVIALPTRARIYVTYDGEWRAEAFLWLRKL